jgi:molybdenum cofactor cytidylyltransferase
VVAGALLIAAGFSRRFGSDKRLHRLPDGRILLIASLAPYRDAFRNVAIVIRETDSAVLAELRRAFADRMPIVATTANAAAGMAASLADGVRALLDWDYLFVGLADMPYVQATTLRTLEAHMRAARAERLPRIVQPWFRGAPGHPVGFSREFFADLLRLEGDHGARSVVLAHPEAVERVDVDDAGVLLDVDQPSD